MKVWVVVMHDEGIDSVEGVAATADAARALMRRVVLGTYHADDGTPEADEVWALSEWSVHVDGSIEWNGLQDGWTLTAEEQEVHE